MAVRTFNNNDNINVPNSLSVWFQENWTGNYIELGDCVVDGVTVSPEFFDFSSYRNGRYGLRKRLLVQNGGSVNLTLNEINITNLQRILYGGTIAEGQSVTAYDARTLTVATDTAGTYVDFTGITEATLANITVTEIYEETDILEATSATISNSTPDSEDRVYFTNGTGMSATTGSEVYVKYTYAYSSMYSSSIFGATNSTIEGAAQLQARSLSGGIVQIWTLSSVTLSPNGDVTYPMDTVQTLPITLTMQERAGSWGTLYVQ